MKVRELIGELGKLNSETDIGFALTFIYKRMLLSVKVFVRIEI